MSTTYRRGAMVTDQVREQGRCDTLTTERWSHAKQDHLVTACYRKTEHVTGCAALCDDTGGAKQGVADCHGAWGR